MVQEWLCVLYRDKARMAPMLPTMVAALHVLHALPEMEALQVLSRCEETRVAFAAHSNSLCDGCACSTTTMK